MDYSHKTVFISGANRGIGYELAQQLTQKSCNVVAGYREQARSTALLELAEERANLFPFKVDVSLEKELTALRTYLDDTFGQLDVLINNAGINLKRSLSLNELDWPTIAHHLEVNVGGAFLCGQILYPLLKKGADKKIINISSRLGSIALTGGTSSSYAISKAALNMLGKHQALAYKADGIAVICLHPGWVRTDMGGASAPYSVQESARHILDIADTLSLEQSGQFIDIDGQIIPY